VAFDDGAVIATHRHTMVTDRFGRPRNFSAFLFWFVTLQCLFAGGFLLSICILSWAGGYFGFLIPATWGKLLIQAGSSMQGVAMWLSILLGAWCASTHNLGLWRGVGGWFVGFFLSTLLIMPLLITGESGFGFGSVADFYVYAGLCLAYTVIAGCLVVWRRRHSRRLQNDLLRTFD
jgi:hypothetical protein